MALTTLLYVVRDRFGVDVDPDSDAGQILNSLTTQSSFGIADLSGEADASAITFSPTSDGVSVRAAEASDALVFGIPVGKVKFTLVPRDLANPPRVELELIAPVVPLPFFRAAAPNGDGTLRDEQAKVELRFPALLLIVTVPNETPASARLAPSHNAQGALEVAMVPPFVLIGPETVLGLHFDKAMLKLEPGDPELTIPTLEVFIAPEGIPPLAMHGGGHDLRFGLGAGNSGLTGEIVIALADGAHAPHRPRFLKQMAARLRLARNSVTLLELKGQIELTAEIEQRLGTQLPNAPGLIDYRLQLDLDAYWKASLTLSTSDGRDFLWRTQRTDPNTRDLPRDTIGAYSVFAPLLATSLPGTGSSGFVDLELAAGVSTALAASQWISTQSITLYGGELIVRQAAGGKAAFLFFDIETTLDLNVDVDGTRLIATKRPLKVRQKSIGMKLDFGGGADLKPVFDPSQGFSLDLTDPGTFDIPGPLGDILQPDKARIARENPLTFEVDLVTKIDLGIVTIDRASVRVPLDSPAVPTLTGLGAHINAGVLQGGGYLRILKGGIAGGFDASIGQPLGLRASADLRLDKAVDQATNESLTSVLAAFTVEWPVPIPLGTSGLGLFGFLGLFGMHLERNEPAGGALQWLKNAGGDPGKGDWRGAANHWAIGLGAVIGTLEGGFLVHAKGMLLLELPGPRILFVMKADLLLPRPPKEGDTTGSLLAVIDIRPESITIGLIAEYKIPFLLEVQLPVDAYFNFKDLSNWHLDIGAIPGDTNRLPVSVKFMSNIRADGYLLMHGDGIPKFPLRELKGLSVAAGIRAALTWGPEEIGLYIRVSAEADVGLSFKPFVVIGRVKLEGELHLFIISIGASASATVLITKDDFYVEAEVCGHVDFFFFRVEGCVTLKLGNSNLQPPEPDPLIRALSLHSRTTNVLLPGSGADRAVDGSLGTAFHEDGNGQFVGPTAAAGTPAPGMPIVPVDAIPVLQFEMRPVVAGGCSFFAQPIPSLLAADVWTRRGERFYRYTLRSVELTGVDGPGRASPVESGDTPAVWWDREGQPVAGDDGDVQLALLNWLPDPTPAAAERTTSRDQEIKRRWGDICKQVAPPAGVLWSFAQETPGPSTTGWVLRGTIRPDPPGTIRSSPPKTILRVTEPWRSGTSVADALVDVVPAYVSTCRTLADRLLVAPQTGRSPRPRISDDARFLELFQSFFPGNRTFIPAALRLDADGIRRIRGLLFFDRQLEERILRGLDRDGVPTGFAQPLDATVGRRIDGADDLPPEWTDPIGLWAPIARRTIDAWESCFVGPLGEPGLYFFEIELPENVVHVEIGIGETERSEQPKWGVLLIEAIGSAEFARASFDETKRKTTISVVDGALGSDQSQRALLRPGSRYTVRVTYDVESAPAGKECDPDMSAVARINGKKQEFQFQTDNVAPARLDPWVLATSPSAGDSAFFTKDPIRIAFATNATRRMFKAYGLELFAVVKAASGRHPTAAAGFDAAETLLTETPLAGTQPRLINRSPLVESPFLGALRDLAANLPCVNRNGQAAAHEIVTLNLQMEPRTEYILDLEARPLAGDPSQPMFRLNFTTSRYADLAAFAAEVSGTPVGHRALADPAPLVNLEAAGGLVAAITDIEFETALRAVRWGDLKRSTAPRVTVIWNNGAPPQPVGIYLEATEPFWRFHGIPEWVPAPDDAPDDARRTKLVSHPWLELVETAGASHIARFLRSTDGARSLAVLKPGCRGGSVGISFRRTAHPLFEGHSNSTLVSAATIALIRAPWEETP